MFWRSYNLLHIEILRSWRTWFRFGFRNNAKTTRQWPITGNSIVVAYWKVGQSPRLQGHRALAAQAAQKLPQSGISCYPIPSACFLPHAKSEIIARGSLGWQVLESLSIGIWRDPRTVAILIKNAPADLTAHTNQSAALLAGVSNPKAEH